MIPSRIFPVAPAYHIVGENDGAHTSQGRTSFLHIRSKSSVVFGLSPMSMRAKHRRKMSPAAARPVQTARNEYARQTLEPHVFHRVAFVFALAADDRIKRALLGHRQQLRSAKDCLANPFCASFPPSQAGIASSKLGKLLFGRGLAVIMSLTKLGLFVFSTFNEPARKCNCKH